MVAWVSICHEDKTIFRAYCGQSALLVGKGKLKRNTVIKEGPIYLEALPLHTYEDKIAF